MQNGTEGRRTSQLAGEASTSGDRQHCGEKFCPWMRESTLEEGTGEKRAGAFAVAQ